ncbi:uncharacterized protein LOC119382286 [Rhipicephalus sanguineus]|uniref:uncharacterized protein LOC119382286 n=1 Tax=Rhipicephalus sanguineus TaxID=34632 RepID=UPI0020C4B1DE|nr:uncharacterized protein LOC119382286 [Rhipicephalus sanguineus]
MCSGEVPKDDWSTLSQATLPNSVLTVAEALLSILTFCISAGLNWSQMEDLVKLVNFLLGETVIPCSRHLLKKMWETSDTVCHHFFCSSCKTYAGKRAAQDITCSNCSENVCLSNFKKSNFFSTLSVKKQLEDLLMSKSVAQALFDQLSSPGSASCLLRDITDGTLLKKCRKHSEWADITITVNTDGARVFNSSKDSLWPIQLVVNELPVLLRWSNVLLGGVWFGRGHPDMQLFFGTFVKELNEMGAVVWRCGSRIMKSVVRVACVCVDAPARALVLHMKQFNGHYGCSFCLERGTFLHGALRYVLPGSDAQEAASERSTAGMKQDAKEASRCGAPVNGVKGSTALSKLDAYDVVWGTCPDYMHVVLEGVSKQFCAMWLQSTGSQYYIGSRKTIEHLNSRILAMKPPNWFTRLPRKLSDYSMWKASEWKWWLLHYSLPTLTGILPTRYVKHFSLLVQGIYILLKDEITNDDIITSSDALSEFVAHTQMLYGTSAMTFNVHGLLHLPKSVAKLGPLWSHSSFVFENGNGTLVKLVAGACGVPLQILERYVLSRKLKTLPYSLQLSPQSQIYFGLQKPTTGSGMMLLGIGRRCTDAEYQNLVLRLGHPPEVLVEYYRALISGQMVHSVNYKRPQRTFNAAFVSRSGKFFLVNRMFDGASSDAILECQELIPSQKLFASHILVCTKSTDFAFVHSSDFYRLCVFMEVEGTIFVSTIPNLHEKD